MCQRPGAAFGIRESARIISAEFSGPHPAGAAGAQVHRLNPVENKGSVWTIDYQDVIAIGYLLQTGQYFSKRVIALSGPFVQRPRLIRTCLGASLHELTADELVASGYAKVISGSALSGRTTQFLGRYHRQVTAIPDSAKSQGRFPFLKAKNPAPQPLVPTRAIEGALPFHIPPVPLMRALSVGDSETARRLGCLALVEEDVALLTALCASGVDYGSLLRQVLTDLENAA